MFSKVKGFLSGITVADINMCAAGFCFGIMIMSLIAKNWYHAAIEMVLCLANFFSYMWLKKD